MTPDMRPQVSANKNLPGPGLPWALLPCALLLTGCAPPPEPVFGGGGLNDFQVQRLTWITDNWAEMNEACDLDVGQILSNSYPNSRDGFDCAAVASRHLGLDQSSFDFDTTEGRNTYNRLLSVMNFLATMDMGTVDDLVDPGDDSIESWVHKPFIDSMRRLSDWLGYQEVAPLVYSMVSSMILETRWSDDPIQPYAAASVNYSSRVVSIYVAPDYPGQAAVYLTHEAAHVWTRQGHVVCPADSVFQSTDYSGVAVCDADWSGARSYAAATMQLVYDHLCVEDQGYNPQLVDNYCGPIAAAGWRQVSWIIPFIELSAAAE